MINLESVTNKIINRLCDYLSHWLPLSAPSEPHPPLRLSGLLHHTRTTLVKSRLITNAHYN